MPSSKLEVRLNDILDRFGETSKAELGGELADAFALDGESHYADQITAQLDRTLTSEERFRIGVLERAHRFYDGSEEEEE